MFGAGVDLVVQHHKPSLEQSTTNRDKLKEVDTMDITTDRKVYFNRIIIKKRNSIAKINIFV